MRKRFFLLAGVACISTCVSGSLFGQKPAWQPAPGHLSIPLWPQGAPGAQANPPPEIDTTTAKDRLVAGNPVIRLGNVSAPTLTLYAPKGKNTGVGIVVFPGGSYKILAIDLEGTEVCDWLNSAGINCILIKYRVPDTGPYPKSSAALQDAQRAVGIVRSHAAEWHIDSNRVGVLGFSAGAHLAAALSTHFDQRLYDPIDAADQLEQPALFPNAVKFGILPQIAALETMIYPTSLQLLGNNTLAQSGTLEIAPMEAPLSLFVWSVNRIVPVRITDFSVTEEAFDPTLNPIRAKVSLGMRVLSVDDLGFDNVGGNLYMAYQQQKERLSSLAPIGTFSALGIGGI